MGKKKNNKFVTTILIGGALGSIAALVFGGKSKTPSSTGKQGILGRLFGGRGKK